MLEAELGGVFPWIFLPFYSNTDPNVTVTAALPAQALLGSLACQPPFPFQTVHFVILSASFTLFLRWLAQSGYK